MCFLFFVCDNYSISKFCLLVKKKFIQQNQLVLYWYNSATFCHIPKFYIGIKSKGNRLVLRDNSSDTNFTINFFYKRSPSISVWSCILVAPNEIALQANSIEPIYDNLFRCQKKKKLRKLWINIQTIGLNFIT